MGKYKTFHYCNVDGCMNKQDNANLSFFSLPIDRERRNEWLERIGRPDLLSKPDLKHSSYKVCSAHFEDDMLSTVVVRKLLPGAVPTKYLTEPQTTSQNDVKSENVHSPVNSDVSTQTKDSKDNIVLSSVELTKYALMSFMTTADTQSDSSVKEAITQTSTELSSKSSRKRKLHAQLQASERKRRKLEHELNMLKQQIEAKNETKTAQIARRKSI